MIFLFIFSQNKGNKINVYRSKQYVQKINPHDCTSIFSISLNYKIMYNLLQIF